MTIHVNGEPRDVADNTTIATLLEQLDIRMSGVAVERNLAVIPRAEHPNTPLADGDRVEIVTLVGGG